ERVRATLLPLPREDPPRAELLSHILVSVPSPRSLVPRPNLLHRILASTNQKRGVGKTTTSVNPAPSFSATKRRVLLLDMDPQGNATMGCGVDKRSLERSTTDVLLGECGAGDAIFSVDYADFKLMPANQYLVAA